MIAAAAMSVRQVYRPNMREGRERRKTQTRRHSKRRHNNENKSGNGSRRVGTQEETRDSLALQRWKGRTDTQHKKSDGEQKRCHPHPCTAPEETTYTPGHAKRRFSFRSGVHVSVGLYPSTTRR